MHSPLVSVQTYDLLNFDNLGPSQVKCSGTNLIFSFGDIPFKANTTFTMKCKCTLHVVFAHPKFA